MQNVFCPLSQAIAVNLNQHESWLSVGPQALANGFSALDLDLPALPGLSSGGQQTLSRTQFHAYAALYYYGVIEQTGLCDLAELIAQERDMLDIRDRGLYQKLDDLYRATRGDWYSAERRRTIFDRMLGLGQPDGIDSALAAYAQAIEQFETAYHLQGRPDYRAEAGLTFARQQLSEFVSRRATMGVEQASQRLNRQLRMVTEVMSQPALHRRYGAMDMWGVLSTLVAPTGGGAVLDLGRAVRRARSGSSLLAALAAPPALTADTMRTAAEWLMNAPQMSGAQIPTAPPSQSPYTARRQTGGWA
ncbi:MAG: hypothetical protein AAFR74_01015 [Pseudomonadota bacterium]